ncbi:hypothetical protein Leryth_005648 [Lithospermum erythrorhizon]|nr:hypothetical protein Leryth_005648 [Lithospermum erythrorhizon]
MDFFKKAKSVRLKSHHEKFLTADQDQETVIQDRNNSSKAAKWEVEFVDDYEVVIRLKSCFGKYLTATEDQYLLGVTGRKVKQTLPMKLDSSVEWEPIKEGEHVRLKTRYGNFLRANGGVPPWRNSVTHDIPHRHTDWVLWDVDLVELRGELPEKMQEVDQVVEDDALVFTLRTPGFSPEKSFDLADSSSPKTPEGRTIYYKVIDESGNIDDEQEEPSFMFNGHGLEDLTHKLEEVTGHENIIVCSCNKINGQLFPLRLSLPPNNATMHIVVVPSTSKVTNLVCVPEE